MVKQIKRLTSINIYGSICIMKIILSETLKDYINNFESVEGAAKQLDVASSTIYALMSGRQNPSTEFIAKVKQNVGWTFEKAFDIDKEGK